MTKSDKNGHAEPLSIEQHSAIALLLTGLTDADVAAKIGRQRQTIVHWKHHNPKFQAQLNKECHSLWGAYTARLRGLLPLALAVVEQELKSGDHRVRVALELLKLAGMSLFPVGLTDEEEIIQGEVERRGRMQRASMGLLFDARTIRQEILSKAREDDD